MPGNTPRIELNDLNQTSGFIELFTLDCSIIGGLIYRFTPTPHEDGYVTFGGNAYYCLPIKSEGWELNSSGTQPRPTLTVSNVNKTLLNAVISLGDIVGAKVKRLRTYAKFLDGMPEADNLAHLPVEIFFIEQKISHVNEVISWQLSSPIEGFGLKLPRRQILKDKGFPGVARYRGAA